MKQLVFTPPLCKAPLKGFVLKAKKLRPLAQRFAFPVVRYLRHVCAWAAIVRLHIRRRPPAVFRAVVAFVVCSVERMLRTWTRAHIRHKVSKRGPSLANSNATTAVSWVALIVDLVTARTHAAPNDVLRQVPAAMRFLRGRGALLVKASAGLRQTLGHVVRLHDAFSTAVAKAFPGSFAAYVFGSCKSDKPPKSCASDVICFSHTGIVIKRQTTAGHLFMRAT